jgi:hypothetical protein
MEKNKEDEQDKHMKQKIENIEHKISQLIDIDDIPKITNELTKILDEIKLLSRIKK